MIATQDRDRRVKNSGERIRVQARRDGQAGWKRRNYKRGYRIWCARFGRLVYRGGRKRGQTVDETFEMEHEMRIVLFKRGQGMYRRAAKVVCTCFFDTCLKVVCSPRQ